MAVICGAKVEADFVLVSGGAEFDGIFGILTRIARQIFERFEKVPVAVSLFRCFFLRSPFRILVNSFMWLRIQPLSFFQMCVLPVWLYIPRAPWDGNRSLVEMAISSKIQLNCWLFKRDCSMCFRQEKKTRLIVIGNPFT